MSTPYSHAFPTAASNARRSLRRSSRCRIVAKAANEASPCGWASLVKVWPGPTSSRTASGKPASSPNPAANCTGSRLCLIQ
ncbi:Uncharacterised protein [Mycobacteroides abscessus subsp. abscessus]|nr:Uncharacterised protein [Mycobacteroides abscessus subsp. abscessus]